MKTSETRFINQCTLVQIKPEDNEALLVCSDTLRKHGILTTVFDDLRITKQVVERLKPRGEYGDLIKAVGHLWDGDVAASAAIVGKTPVRVIQRFAEDALATERSLFEKAEAEVGKAIDQMVRATVPKADTCEATATALRREMAEMRRSIVEDVRGLVRQEARETLAAKAPESERSARASGLSAGPATVVSSAPPQQVPTVPRVTMDGIQKEILTQFGETAAFLGAVGFFARPIVLAPGAMAGVAHTQAFMDLYLRRVEQKEKQVKALYDMIQVHPIGYLALERLNFTALGYVRGDLVYSLPMLPGETVRLSHREWSRTEQEYVKLVQTSLEKDTEEVLSEKSELTQSYNTQEQHTDAFNAAASVSGTYGTISFSSSVGYNAANAEAQSSQSSAKRAQEISRKAASRTKQELKMSFRVTSQYEVEEQSFREITNKSDQAIRWDFHRLMKKWRIDLYRYGARLTYDLVIPEPGSYLLRKHLLLKAVNDTLAKPNPFDVSAGNITRDNWSDLQKRWGASLSPPPPRYADFDARATVSYAQQRLASGVLEIAAPEGYYIEDIMEAWYDDFFPEGIGHIVNFGSVNTSRITSAAPYQTLNRFQWPYWISWHPDAKQGSTLSLLLRVRSKLTDRAFLEWQKDCFDKLSDAAKAMYQNERARLEKLRDDLLAELNREDALMLRKLEKEEIMKGVLRWVLGPAFNFFPPSQEQLALPDLKPALGIDPAKSDLEYYYSEGEQSLKSDKVWEATLQHGEIVKFLHQAIEWENVNYLLYPYFWTDDARWDFKQSLYHPDYVHRSFLRAGAARVVLTIRPGFEKDFVRFTETLQLDQTLPNEDNHPYMSIASEIEQMAKTTYPYTESPNKENEEYHVKFWYEFTPTGALDVVEGTVLLEDEDADVENPA